MRYYYKFSTEYLKTLNDTSVRPYRRSISQSPIKQNELSLKPSNWRHIHWVLPVTFLSFSKYYSMYIAFDPLDPLEALFQLHYMHLPRSPAPTYLPERAQQTSEVFKKSSACDPSIFQESILEDDGRWNEKAEDVGWRLIGEKRSLCFLLYGRARNSTSLSQAQLKVR